MNNHIIPIDSPLFNDYTLLGKSNFDNVAVKTTRKQREIKVAKSSLGRERNVLGFATATSRQLEEQTTTDGTKLPEAISWENILQERKMNQTKELLTKREMKEKRQLKKAPPKKQTT